MYIEKVLDLRVKLMKNGGKKKCCVHNFVQCICMYIFMPLNTTPLKEPIKHEFIVHILVLKCKCTKEM